MAIHFLNCGTMKPYFPRVENGITCILVDTNMGLVLVDTGLGSQDYLHPTAGMSFFLNLMRSPRDPRETAIQQIQRLGYRPEDVGHIIQTHLHLDHAGGLRDFPRAKVHLHKAEYEHILTRHSWEYRSEHWSHNPNWILHEPNGGKWYDFEAVSLPGLHPEIWLIPLTGHTPGHCAVAMKSEHGWILHGGDAVPFDVKVDEVPDWISKLVIGPNVPRVREFMKIHPEVQVIGSHMSLNFYEAVL